MMPELNFIRRNTALLQVRPARQSEEKKRKVCSTKN